ncbi:MAG: alanine racemase [Alphaproteobacteria bacterium]|nr:alanine racemase [Alphaproteobacteria bacterium]
MPLSCPTTLCSELTPAVPTLYVDLDAVAHNFRTHAQWFAAGKRHAHAPGQRVEHATTKSPIAAVVKADGYGLGAVPIARRLVREGCTAFFVATLAEGIALRAGLTTASVDAACASKLSITVFEGFGASSQSAEQVRQIYACYAQHRLTMVLSQPADIKRYQQAVGSWAQSPVVDCWLHIETGMNRQGLSEAEALDTIADATATGRAAWWSACIGVMSHFACADNPASRQTRTQAEQFARLCARLRPQDGRQFSFAVANSAGIQTMATSGDAALLSLLSVCDAARLGVGLYGVDPIEDNGVPHPALQAVARIAAPVHQLHCIEAGETVSYGATWQATKRTWIGTVRVGYADGFVRLLSGRWGGVVTHRGARFFCPQVGRITMDYMMFDVSAAVAAIGHNAVDQLAPPDNPDHPDRAALWIDLLSPACCAATALNGAAGSRKSNAAGTVVTAERAESQPLFGNTIYDLATACGDIPYALLTGLRSFRGDRIYLEASLPDPVLPSQFQASE